MTGMTERERIREWLGKIRAETDSANKTARDAIGLLSRDGESIENARGPSVHDPVDLSTLESYMVVGKAAGKPGETVAVEVLAMAKFPVKGIAIAIGLNPLATFVTAEETEELKNLLGVNDPQDVKKQHRGRNWEQQFVQLAIMFYESIWTQEEIETTKAEDVDPKTPKRRIVETEIPSMTPVYRMHIKIPSDAEPGSTIPLDVGQRYGHRLSSNGPIKFLPWENLFATSREVSRTGKYPDEMVSGWIDVIE